MVLIVFTPVARILVGFRSGKVTVWKVTSHWGCKLMHVVHQHIWPSFDCRLGLHARIFHYCSSARFTVLMNNVYSRNKLHLLAL